MGRMTIEQMQLAPHVRPLAQRLQDEFGDVIVWTCGYRPLQRQAAAMAQNVILNRRWIAQTYTRTGRPSFAIGLRLQTWLDQHPDVQDVPALTEALYAELNAIPNGRLISRHSWQVNAQPASLAFDLQPVEHDGAITAMGQEIWDRILKLPHLDPPPLRREGGLARWHVQFMPLDVSVTV